MTVHLQYKGGANWSVKKPSFISFSKAPGALIRKNTVIKILSKIFIFLPFSMSIAYHKATLSAKYETDSVSRDNLTNGNIFWIA